MSRNNAIAISLVTEIFGGTVFFLGCFAKWQNNFEQVACLIIGGLLFLSASLNLLIRYR